MDRPLIKKEKALPANTADVCWVFDLDNTLYPAECSLFGQIEEKIGAYISNLLDVDRAEARRVQKDFFVRHGTTLRGLIDEHGVDPVEFLDFIHDIDLNPLKEDRELQGALKKLKGSKFVFTNGDSPYAGRILKKIGISSEFEGVFDIADAGYHPKPNVKAYETFVERFDVEPKNAVMIEDMARNLVPAAQMGMTTVWLKTNDRWGGHYGHDEAHIHHETDHLAGWLTQCIEASA